MADDLIVTSLIRVGPHRSYLCTGDIRSGKGVVTSPIRAGPHRSAISGSRQPFLRCQLLRLFGRGHIEAKSRKARWRLGLAGYPAYSGGATSKGWYSAWYVFPSTCGPIYLDGATSKSGEKQCHSLSACRLPYLLIWVHIEANGSDGDWYGRFILPRLFRRGHIEVAITASA